MRRLTSKNRVFGSYHYFHLTDPATNLFLIDENLTHRRR